MVQPPTSVIDELNDFFFFFFFFLQISYAE